MDTSSMSTQLEAFRVAVQKDMKVRFVTFKKDKDDIDNIITEAYKATLSMFNVPTTPKTTTMASDLILMATVYPTIDGNLKTMLLSIAKLSVSTADSNPIQALTEWMLTTSADRYWLFMEVLREIALQAEQNSKTEQKKERQIPVIIEGNTHTPIAASKSFCEVMSSTGKKCRFAVMAGTTLCPKHAIKFSTNEQPEVVARGQKQKESRCQIAVGNNLLDLHQCDNQGSRSHSIISSPKIDICLEHQLSITKANPKNIRGLTFVDHGTPVRLFNSSSRQLRILPNWARSPMRCQIQSNENGQCELQATHSNDYGALICQKHSSGTIKGDTVPCDSKSVSFIEKKEPQKPAEEVEVINMLQPCQVVAQTTGQLCGIKTANRVEQDGKPIAMCARHHEIHKKDLELAKTTKPQLELLPCQMMLGTPHKRCQSMTTNRVTDRHLQNIPICPEHQKLREDRIKAYACSNLFTAVEQFEDSN
jgi:hypothetical protein